MANEAQLVFDRVTFVWEGGGGGDGARSPGAASEAQTAAAACGEPGARGLCAVDLSLAAGDFALITGPSGAGKSTLLRLVAWLEEPQEGRLLLDGRAYADWGAQAVRARIGFVQQLPVLLAGSVRDNLLLPFTFRANRDLTPPDDATLREWLARFGLDVPLEQTARDCSIGQQQRVCIIRAVLRGASILLLDEPTSALDPASRRLVEKGIEALNAEGKTILLVSHSDYAPACPHRRLEVAAGHVAEMS